MQVTEVNRANGPATAAARTASDKAVARRWLIRRRQWHSPTPGPIAASDFGNDHLSHNVSTLGHDSFKGMGVDFGDLSDNGSVEWTRVYCDCLAKNAVSSAATSAGRPESSGAVCPAPGSIFSVAAGSTSASRRSVRWR